MTYFRPVNFARTIGFAAFLWTACRHSWRQNILIVNARDEQTKSEKKHSNTFSEISNRPQSTPIRPANQRNVIETPSANLRPHQITRRQLFPESDQSTSHQPAISHTPYGTPISHRRCISCRPTQETEPSGNKHLTRDIYRPAPTPVRPSTSSKIVDDDLDTQESPPLYLATLRPSSSFHPAQENINNEQTTPGFLPDRVSVPPRTSSVSTPASIKCNPKSRSSNRTFGTVLRGPNVDQPVEKQQKYKAEERESVKRTNDELRSAIKELKVEIQKLPRQKFESKQRLRRLTDEEFPPESKRVNGKTSSISERNVIAQKPHLESNFSKNKSTSAHGFPRDRKLELKKDDKTPHTKSSDLIMSKSVDELSPIHELSPFGLKHDKTLHEVNTEDETLTMPHTRSEKKKDDLRSFSRPKTSRKKHRRDENDIKDVSATRAKCDFLEKSLGSGEEIEDLENINDLEDLHDLHDSEDLHNLHDSEDLHNLHDSEDLHNLHDSEDLHNLHDSEDLHNLHDSEDLEDFDDSEDLEDENSFTVRDETKDESGNSKYEDAKDRSSYSNYEDAKDQNYYSVSDDSKDQNDSSVFHDANEQFENSLAIINKEMSKSHELVPISTTDQTQLNIEKESDEQFFSCLNSSGSLASSEEEINPHFQVQNRIILVEDDFLLCYDNQTRTPLWTLEMVTRENAQPIGWCHPPMNCTDCRIDEEFRSTKDDYSDGNSFKETRLAYAELHTNDITETCLFSNVAPQETGGRPDCVKTVWNELYEYIAYLTNLHAQIWILSGVLYKPGFMNNEWAVTSQLVGINKVAVPTDFFKVILAPNCDCPGFRLECFRIKNEFSDNLDVRDYHVSRYELQKDAGFLIFDEVADCYVTTCDTDPNFAQRYCLLSSPTKCCNCQRE